jgi:hypothetical protein
MWSQLQRTAPLRCIHEYFKDETRLKWHDSVEIRRFGTVYWTVKCIL